jgi:hypothetical protein
VELRAQFLYKIYAMKKHVFIRHSLNKWDTFQDITAEWVETMEGGAVDRFQHSNIYTYP